MNRILPPPAKGNALSRIFTRLAKGASYGAGTPLAFCLASGFILLWAMAGPLLDFSQRWQMVVNTVTTIVTFLLVFLIQHSQNRDTHALHLKIDELIRATHGAHTGLIDLEKMDEEELMEIHKRYKSLAQKARQLMREGGDDTEIINIALNRKS
jgi:low affinity Fe/Cu permease